MHYIIYEKQEFDLANAKKEELKQFLFNKKRPFDIVY